ncbi:MAG: 3-deoxy-manno-octulosonate cytidylyltransferase [Acidobacteriota bacterium]
MNIAAIIPSRFESSRFPGKPLTNILGISMIERVYNQVKKSDKFEDIIVATDNKKIADKVKEFGGKSIMTSRQCSSGTERVWEVLKKSDYDAVINIQGDEPLISEKLISDIYDELDTGEHDVITAAFFNTSIEDYLSENVVKAVVNNNSEALYFSRSPVPFVKRDEFAGFFQHIGIYGYLKKSIESFFNFPLSDLEKCEKLEQLRFMDYGVTIKIIETNYRSYGVDVPEDVKKIEKLLRENEIEN